MTAQYNFSARNEVGRHAHWDDAELPNCEDWSTDSEAVEDAGAVPHGITWRTRSWF